MEKKFSKAHTSIKEYRVWTAMKSRCNNPNVSCFKYYGGRGISVCLHWQIGKNGKSGFECFIADMGRRPSDSHSIDRIDVNGNYEPNNCRWATIEEQNRNRSHSKWHKELTFSKSKTKKPFNIISSPLKNNTDCNFDYSDIIRGYTQSINLTNNHKI